MTALIMEKFPDTDDRFEMFNITDRNEISVSAFTEIIDFFDRKFITGNEAYEELENERDEYCSGNDSLQAQVCDLNTDLECRDAKIDELEKKIREMEEA